MVVQRLGMLSAMVQRLKISIRNGFEAGNSMYSGTEAGNYMYEYIGTKAGN